MIEPFFFDNARLFGCYHAAEEWPAPRLLVICPPLFDEYRRCYRALSELANACAKENVHVVRFDYYGTGESQGDLQDATVEDWLRGINLAIEEGLAISGAEDVVLMGVRFGATLAAQIDSAEIVRKIFWDPVQSGEAYLRWLGKVNESIAIDHREMVKSANLRQDDRPYDNFSLPQQFCEDLSHLEFDTDKLLADKNNFIISTNRSEAANFSHENLIFGHFDYDWPEYHDGILSPKPVLETIAQKVLLP